MAEPVPQTWLFGADDSAGSGLLSSACIVRRPERSATIARQTSRRSKLTTTNAVLIVNADDFGLTEGTNQAIIDAHRNGIVTSTSLLANGTAFDQAVELAKDHPTLGVGLHLTLTEGLPVSSGTTTVALVGPDGKLPLSNQPFVRAWLRRELPRDAIRREFEAQAQKLVSAGIKPTHIDSHKYIHLLPGIRPIAIDVARRFSIQVVRVPHRVADQFSKPSRLLGLLVIAGLGTLAYQGISGARIADRIIGFVDTGHLTKARLAVLLRKPYSGVTELLCHPAYRTPYLEALAASGYDWINDFDFEGETAAVSDPALRERLVSAGWTLSHFGAASRLHRRR